MFGLHPGVPAADGAEADGTDGVRIGSSRILTLGPERTATSGTLYVRGRRGQFAVRILGATGRTRVLRFHPGTGHWTTPCPSVYFMTGVPVDGPILVV